MFWCQWKINFNKKKIRNKILIFSSQNFYGGAGILTNLQSIGQPHPLIYIPLFMANWNLLRLTFCEVYVTALYAPSRNAQWFTTYSSLGNNADDYHSSNAYQHMSRMSNNNTPCKIHKCKYNGVVLTFMLTVLWLPLKVLCWFTFSSHPHASLLFVLRKLQKNTYWQHFSKLMLVCLEMQRP